MTTKASLRPVGVAETPSQSVVNAAAALKYGTDRRGRKIGIVKPNALTRVYLYNILGAEGSMNQPLVSTGLLAMACREIDGITVTMPNSKNELNARIGMLDDPGLVCIGETLAREYPGDYGSGDDDTESEVDDGAAA